MRKEKRDMRYTVNYFGAFFNVGTKRRRTTAEAKGAKNVRPAGNVRKITRRPTAI
jgi:hypothetical protein